MSQECSETGVWVDVATGQVVTSPPVSGVQLVAPGGVLDDVAKRAIAAATEAAPAPAPAPKKKPSKATAPAATETR